MTAGATPDDPGLLAEAIANEVLGHPAVVRLDGGAFGALATHLPGRKVAGVRVTELGEPVEIGVVLRLTGSLPAVTGDLRTRVRAIAGDVPVHVEVTDVDTGEVPSEVDGTAPGTPEQPGKRVG
ncbi:hypothetical protein CFN78_21590 [Amycolatopsis antarctica]|uniref:Asp23/Gls24 family protein n=1 Tax=Amycolatopsis antarctica TaxID=1854586 RepID=A0A263CY39_9PSEU|nr:hypothetical protein [Amycolatopsis antarctica]OZM71070.1 hypothetical protein CFN78_21590 [Amycolatopsis antarctica]